MEKSSTKKNVLIYGFSSSNEAPIINELKKREKVQVVAWINSRFSDGDFGNINHCRLKNYTPNRCPVHIYEEMFSNFMEFFFVEFVLNRCIYKKRNTMTILISSLIM